MAQVEEACLQPEQRAERHVGMHEHDFPELAITEFDFVAVEEVQHAVQEQRDQVGVERGK